MDYVTDTHSILWYFIQDPRLSKRALEVFEGTVREGFIIIPAVVLAEIRNNVYCQKGENNPHF